MGVGLAAVVRVMQQAVLLRKHSAVKVPDVPKGHFALYMGEMEKRFVVPISYLQHPVFQNMLLTAAEEYGFEHPAGVLRLPCNEHAFAVLTAQLNTHACSSVQTLH